MVILPDSASTHVFAPFIIAWSFVTTLVAIHLKVLPNPLTAHFPMIYGWIVSQNVIMWEKFWQILLNVVKNWFIFELARWSISPSSHIFHLVYKKFFNSMEIGAMVILSWFRLSAAITMNTICFWNQIVNVYKNLKLFFQYALATLSCTRCLLIFQQSSFGS